MLLCVFAMFFSSDMSKYVFAVAIRNVAVVPALWVCIEPAFLAFKGLVRSMFAVGHASGWNPCKVEGARREDCALGPCPLL